MQGQKADDIAVARVAKIPDLIDGRAGNSRFLAGEQLTETDTRLFPTSAQFEMTSHGARKCSRQQIVNYPHLTLLWVALRGSDLSLLPVLVRPKIYLFPDCYLHFCLEF